MTSASPRVQRLGFAPALVVATTGLIRALMQPINYDAAWLLYVAGRVMDGSRLYVDLIEINPPLIVWLSVPAMLLERASGLDHTIGFPMLVGFGACISCLASIRLSADVLSEAYRGAFAAAVALVLFVLPWAAWGQREHLMVILCMPHLVSAAGRLRGTRPCPFIGVGVAAGLGYSIKPHFALAFLAVESLVLARTRKIWPVALVISGVGLAYVLAVLVITPEYVPTAWALRDVYNGFVKSPLLEVILNRPLLIASLVSVSILLVPGEGKELRVILGSATTAWIAAVVIQGKGFEYHSIPAFAGALLLLLLGLIALASRAGNNRRSARYVVIAVVLLAVVIGLQKPTAQEAYWRASSLEVQAVMEREPVMVLTTDLGHAWPAVAYADAEWPARVPSLWPFLAGESGFSYGVEWAIESLQQRPTVLVPHAKWSDALRRLLRDSAFQDVWNGYEPVDSLRYFRLYRWNARGASSGSE